MVSKYQLNNSTPYIEGTDILKNKLNLTNSEKIHERERELIEEVWSWLMNNIKKGQI